MKYEKIIIEEIEMEKISHTACACPNDDSNPYSSSFCEDEGNEKLKVVKNDKLSH